MMDVVPVHICVSSITTAAHHAPVHTSWSFQPTNNPAMVSKNTFLIFHAFSMCCPSKNVSCCLLHFNSFFWQILHLVFSASSPAFHNRNPQKTLKWLFYYLTSAEKVSSVCAALWNPWCWHWQPLHERYDGADGARHWRCHSGGLWCSGGEDLLGWHQKSNHQTGVHQRHSAGDHHFFRWGRQSSRESSKISLWKFWMDNQMRK